MTCIAGIASNGKVYMGADRGISNDITIVSVSRPKIYCKDNFVFGYSGAIGTGQLMEMINFNNDYDDPYYTIRLSIVEQMKKAIESFGSTSEENSADFLIGSKGRLFELSTDDWGVIEVEESAVGSGSPIALGSLYTTKHIYTDHAMRVQMAIDAAIHLSPGCAGPVDIISI